MAKLLVPYGGELVNGYLGYSLINVEKSEIQEFYYVISVGVVTSPRCKRS